MKLSELTKLGLSEETDVRVTVDGDERATTGARVITENGRTRVVLVVPAKRVRASRAATTNKQMKEEANDINNQAVDGAARYVGQ